MIWESVPMMTLLDLGIVLLILVTAVFIYRAKHDLLFLSLWIPIRLIVFGLLVVGSYYIFDLFSMFAFPFLLGEEAAMQVMMFQHLNASWVVVFAMVSIICGSFLYIAGKTLPQIAKSEIESKASIRALHDELRKTNSELLQLTMELEDRVAERTRELEAANRELESFSYSVSHDLRAPVRGVDGFSQALLEDFGDKLDVRGREFIQRIRGAAQRMGQLIDDLLSLSRITRAEIRRGSVDMSALAHKIAAELQESPQEHKVEFVIADGLMVNGDPRLLRITLDNLVGNAWKFTAKTPHARIEVGETTEAGKTVYFVSDNGAGFDMAYADKLFGAFQRLHAAAEFPGTGIGLATVQRIINKHGGRIWAEGHEGRGATFYFTL